MCAEMEETPQKRTLLGLAITSIRLPSKTTRQIGHTLHYGPILTINHNKLLITAY